MTPLILSIETATMISSVALHRGGELVNSFEDYVGRTHGDVLWGMVRGLFERSGVKMEALAAVAISGGPGSYTGLRVGCSLAKGICYGYGIPLLAVNTMDTLLASVASYRLVAGKAVWCGLLDARRGKNFAYAIDEVGEVEEATHILDTTAPKAKGWHRARKIYFVGNGAERYATKLAVAFPQSKVVGGGYPKASDLGKLAYQRWCREDFVELASFSPLYLSAWA